VRAVLPMMQAPDGPRVTLITSAAVTVGRHYSPPALVFGDGGGALILTRRDAYPKARQALLPHVAATSFRTYPEFADVFACEANPRVLRKEGRLEPSWYTIMVRDRKGFERLRLTNFQLGGQAILALLEQVGWSVDSLRWLVTDNVSVKVGEELALRIGLPLERVFRENVLKRGHAYGTDLFVNLRTVLDNHPLRPKQRLALVGMGIGEHWGVILLEG
jgi:3-oxoacyl-[acyl-carrier-protein] synthase III